MVYETLLFCLLGYLSGSVLYSLLYVRLFHLADIRIDSNDHNPGVSNAFKNGGIKCGLFALFGDFFKAFFPVFLYIHYTQASLSDFGIASVMLAPILGHLYPLFYHFKGGKGITSSFGVLAALLPIWQPLIDLILLFLLFSCVFVIRPNYYKTLITYFLLIVSLIYAPIESAIKLGVFFIALSILVKLLSSKEKKEIFRMVPIWKH